MIFCVDAFTVVPAPWNGETGIRSRSAEAVFGTGMVAGRHISPPRPALGWLPKPVFDCMPKNQSAKPMKILHDAGLAVFDAALLDMCGGADFASRTMDWNALIAMFKSHRLTPENGFRKTGTNPAIHQRVTAM